MTWSYPGNSLRCGLRERMTKSAIVLSYRLQHPSYNYPATWEGLYELFKDSELGQVAIELRQAVDNVT